MKQLTILAPLILAISVLQAQEKFNLDFESYSTAQDLPEGWYKWGNYELSTDASAYAGDHSLKITSGETGESFGSVAYTIPANYQGDFITLEGFMKIKGVEGGHAGLLLRVDGDGGSLAFDNMRRQQVTGTRDWEKYYIRLDYPEGARKIIVAGILVGKGEAWFDEFKVSIDGEDLQEKEESMPDLLPAEQDTAFNKGSMVQFSKLTKSKLHDLELLGKVWGFLKYHHPEIAAGNYNWDYELFRFLPGYLMVKKPEERDQMLIDWIKSLGNLKSCTDCVIEDIDPFLRPDFRWKNELGEHLKTALDYVFKNRTTGDHFYIRMAGVVGNPEFRHENPYAQMTYPDAGFRLLSLYRYWNMINYFFPYRHLTDKDWDEVLAAYIPTFLDASNELEYELAVVQLIGEIRDTHANVWYGGDKIEEWKGKYYPPIHVRFIEDQLVVTDYYNPELKEEVMLPVGTVITHIDGKSVRQLVEERNRYYPASNQPTRLRDISQDILRSDSRELKLKCEDQSGKSKSTLLKLYSKDSVDTYRWYPRDDRESYKMLDDNIGYVTLQTIKDADVSEIKEKFKDTAGIIIDIRNYPSAFMPFTLGPYFIAVSRSFAKFTNGSVANPGSFTFREGSIIPRIGPMYEGKLIILVNELTQSSAEYTSMAFRAGENTTIIGSTTAAADGNVSRMWLPGGLQTMISGIGVYYPDGTETQRIGIVPDIEVKPTIKGIREGRDELMEAAIDLILEK